ncbi:TIGR03086 family metal-binding protein [Streptomyces sp. NPDC059009]|uniref:TIGR03086 family metal-binding protein n=1 Tax=Streptomyces sp. NPDC059009 TaxID=3346694 RepID=UPI0036ABCE9B
MTSTNQPLPDPRPLFARASEQLLELVSSVKPEQLSDPTPCTEFDVRALIGHLVGGLKRVAVVGEGGDGLAVDVDIKGLADDAWGAAYDEGRRRAIAAWTDDARLDATVTVPWGEVPGRAAVSGYVMESATHTWDLAVALGRSTGELDQEVARFALGVARQVLPADRRGEGVPFADVQPAAEGADVYGELGAWMGRSAM